MVDSALGPGLMSFSCVQAAHSLGKGGQLAEDVLEDSQDHDNGFQHHLIPGKTPSWQEIPSIWAASVLGNIRTCHAFCLSWTGIKLT